MCLHKDTAAFPGFPRSRGNVPRRVTTATTWQKDEGAPQLCGHHITTNRADDHCANRHKSPTVRLLAALTIAALTSFINSSTAASTGSSHPKLSSTIGVLARVAAQSWVAYDLTQSSLWVGTVAAFRAVPYFLSPAIAAYIGNHVNHRALVAVMRAFIGILAIVQAILIATGTMRPWHQAVLTLLTGLAIAFAWPSFVTFLKDIVQPRMATRANSILAFSHNLGELIGPIAVGVIIVLVGAEWSFVFIAILYLGGAYLILNVPMPDHDSRVGNFHHPYIWTLRIGLRNIGRSQPLPWLIAMLLTTNLFGLAVFPLIPEYAIAVFDSGGLGFGLMTGALGGGLAIGAASAALFGMSGRAPIAAVIASLVWATGTIAFAHSPNLPTTFLILFIMGIASMIWGNAILTMIQSNPFTIRHPNIMSLYTIAMGMIPIGWTIGGTIAHFTTNETALITSATASITIPLIAYIASPAFRRA